MKKILWAGAPMVLARKAETLKEFTGEVIGRPTDLDSTDLEAVAKYAIANGCDAIAFSRNAMITQEFLDTHGIAVFREIVHLIPTGTIIVHTPTGTKKTDYTIEHVSWQRVSKVETREAPHSVFVTFK